MIRRIKRIKPKKRFTPVKVVDPVKTGDELEHLFLPPLEPRRKLFIALSIVFAIWTVFLVVLYSMTVYPQRHQTRHPVTQPTVTEPPATQAI